MSLPALSLFSLSSLGCLYRYMTALPMPLAFRRSLLMTGNCNKRHIPINNTNTNHLPGIAGLQTLTADDRELQQEACNDQIHTWTHLALLTFGCPKSFHVFAPTYMTTSTLQSSKTQTHVCAYTPTNTSQTFHPCKHLTITLEASDKHLTLSLKVKDLYINLVKHFYINLANIWPYKHLTNISFYKHFTNISLYNHLTSQAPHRHLTSQAPHKCFTNTWQMQAPHVHLTSNHKHLSNTVQP